MLKVALIALVGALALPAASDRVELPSPDAARVQQSDLIKAVGGRPDRLLQSVVPGPVVNDETVRIGIGDDGTAREVSADQRLQLQGTGDYAIRERGPARSARSLGEGPPPVTQRGAVVWQGFSPGRRDLAARLLLDPLIEAPHLPLSVTVTGARDGGQVAAGTVTVTLSNTTSQPAEIPTASDAPAARLADPLDRALAVARRPSAARLPTTDDVLPSSLAVTGGARVKGSHAVPLRVTGSLRLTGTTGTVEGPATTPTADGATFAGILGGVRGTASVTFSVQVAGAGRLLLDVTAINALDPSGLAPPRGLPTWKAWARSAPPVSERKAALDLLVEVAAAGARASSYSPYLGADLAGTGSTTFRYAFAAPVERAAPPRVLQPRWGRIAALGAGLLLLLTGGVVLWRRS